MQGNYVHGFHNLAALGVDHFKGLFKEPDKINMDVILKQISLFPQLIEEEENGNMYKEISKEELRGVLASFKKDKSLWLDGWTTKFFQHFFDIVGDDLVQVVEEVHTMGNILHCINATFIAIIPKTDHPLSFNDFMPISLCKRISKIVATHLNHVLSSTISTEQFGFLKG
jgi:hypothetical protein